MILREAWRLLRVKDYKPHTLFHGFHGSKCLVLDRMLRAVEREVCNPGSTESGQVYISGWHVFFDRATCRSYLDKFTPGGGIAVSRVLVACTSPKPRATSEVHLARYMMIRSVDWAKALRCAP